MENREEVAKELHKKIDKNFNFIRTLYDELEADVVDLLGDIFVKKEIIKLKNKGSIDVEKGILPLHVKIFSEYDPYEAFYAIELKIDYDKKEISYRSNTYTQSNIQNENKWYKFSNMVDDLKYNFLSKIVLACGK